MESEKIQQTSDYNNNNNKTDSLIQRINEWLPLGGGEGEQYRDRGIKVTNYYVKNKPQGYIVQQGKIANIS